MKNRLKKLEQILGSRVGERAENERMKAVAELIGWYLVEDKSWGEIEKMCKDKGGVYIQEWKRLSIPTPKKSSITIGEYI